MKLNNGAGITTNGERGGLEGLKYYCIGAVWETALNKKYGGTGSIG